MHLFMHLPWHFSATKLNSGYPSSSRYHLLLLLGMSLIQRSLHRIATSLRRPLASSNTPICTLLYMQCNMSTGTEAASSAKTPQLLLKLRYALLLSFITIYTCFFFHSKSEAFPWGGLSGGTKLKT